LRQDLACDARVTNQDSDAGGPGYGTALDLVRVSGKTFTVAGKQFGIRPVRTYVDATGGPNLRVPNAGFAELVVAHWPGGPLHVLITECAVSVDGVEVRPRPWFCRSRTAKLRAAWSGRRLVGVEAALTKPGRVSTARWCGPGERGGKAYEEPAFTPLKDTPALNLADSGRMRRAFVVDCLSGPARETPWKTRTGSFSRRCCSRGAGWIRRRMR
jgi:hypothetical protein